MDTLAERLERDERRKRILASAIAIIDAEGHQGLNMRRLSRECGMSAPGLMHYFPDMPTLLVAVVAYRDERDSVGFVPPEPGPGISRELLALVVDNIVARPKAAELFAMIEAAAIDPRHPGHEYFRERAEALCDEFAHFLAAEYREPRELAWQLIAILDGLQLNWLRDQDAFDLLARFRAVSDPILDASRLPA